MLLKQTIPALQVKANLSNAEPQAETTQSALRLEPVPDGPREWRAMQPPQWQFKLLSHFPSEFPVNTQALTYLYF